VKFPLEKEFNDNFYLNQIKVLRSKIVHRLESTGKKVVGITSAVDNEGKTTLAYNIAAAISLNRDKKVLLIDGDIRKCGLTQKLGLNGDHGLSEYLVGDENQADSIFKNSAYENFFIISSGKPREESSELLTGKIFRNLIDVIRRKFDIVIMDLPPVISTPDPVAVRDLVDGFIVVYYTGRTSRDLLDYAMNEVGKDKILGVILNRSRNDGFFKYQRSYAQYYLDME
jgi:capsular exopolysaccharide synthesis family protein